MHTKRKVLWFGLVSVVIIASIVATLIAKIPPTSQQLPPNIAQISIVLSRPTDNSTWPADTPIPVAVMVNAGVPIKSVALWADGQLFVSQTPADDQKSIFKVWSWMPLTEGAHTVFVRAVDVNGRTADSNAVHIQASPAAGLIAVQTAQGGETIQSLAEQNGVAPEEIAAINPSIDPAGTIPPGTEFFVALHPFDLSSVGEPPLSLPPAGPVIPAEEGAPIGPAFYLEDILNLHPDAPAAPSLYASVGVCNVSLTIQDNSDSENGFFIYALSDSDVSFKRIASLKSHSGASLLQYSVPNQHGQVQFHVSSYNSAGESPSTPVAVKVTSPQCDPAQGSQGDLDYHGGFLTVPTNVQLAYFYASMNGGAWQRIPAGDEFLEPVTGQIDLRAKIQQLLGGQSNGEADLDVWGWRQGALDHLGKLHLNANFASLAICNLPGGCSGDMGATHWVTEATVGSDKLQTTRPLRWTANGSDITYAIWQVSTQPFPPEYSIGAPPGLLISGISDASVNAETGLAVGDFSIDFNTDLQIPGSGDQEDQPSRKLGPLGQDNTYDPALTSQFAGGPTNLFGLMAYQSWLPHLLYIRVVPMAGGHPASDPSNSVLVSYQPTGDPPPIHISKVPSYSVEILPDSYVNEVKTVQKLGILGCSEIIDVDHDVLTDWFKETYKNAMPDPVILNGKAEEAYKFWSDRKGYIACPGIVNESDPSIPEQFATAFEEMINTLSSTLEQLKGMLVSALAEIIPGCDQTCKSVLMTGLNFAITYFTGLPPSIPNFDEVVNMGIDYAVQMAISQAGIPYCDQTCQDAIAEKIKEVGSGATGSSKSQPACADQNHTLWLYENGQQLHLKPLCFPPGVSFDPLPGSMYENGMVQVRVTRIDGSPEPAPVQLLTLDTQAMNPAFGDGHSQSDYFQTTTQENCQYVQGHQSCANVTHTHYYDMVFNAPLEGIPYPSISIAVPALMTGQSVVVPVVFKSSSYDYKPPNVYLPRAAAIQNTYPGADLNTIPVDWWRDFVHLTGSGSQVTISASVLCQDELAFIYNSPCSEAVTHQFIVP